MPTDCSLKTAGLSLEAIDLCFMDKTTTPVKKANEMRRNIKEGRQVTLRAALVNEKDVEMTAHVESVQD